MNIKTKSILSLIVFSSFGLVSCKNYTEDISKVDRDCFYVTAEKAENRDIEETIVVSGSVNAMDKARLVSRVDGKLIRNVLKEGDRVRKGETVAVIERDEPGVKYEPAPVPSTLTGVIGHVYLDSGANIIKNSTQIAEIVSQEQVSVAIEVPERYVGKIKIGQTGTVKVEAYPGQIFTGKIYRISPQVDTDTRSTLVKILVDNKSGKLKDGMFAEVKVITAAQKNVTSVPTSAIVSEDQKTFVFKPSGDTVSKQEVSVGISDTEYAQITQGVKAGEYVINSGLYGLRDNSKIKLLNSDN